MDKDQVGTQVKVLNWGKANFNDIKKELAKVGLSWLFVSNWTSGKSELIYVIYQCGHMLVIRGPCQLYVIKYKWTKHRKKIIRP